MPNMAEMNLEPTDIVEWYDEFRSIQPLVDPDTNQEYILWTTLCEMCHGVIRRTLREAQTNDLFGPIVDSQVYGCICDEL